MLYRGAKTLILDEPTAVLVPQEVDELFDNLRRLVAQGTTVLFISHKLEEVKRVSHRVAVLRGGTAGGPGPAELFDYTNVAIETVLLLFSSFACGVATLAMAFRAEVMIR